MVLHRIRHLIWYLVNRRQYGYLSPRAYLQKNIRIDGKTGIELHKNSCVQRGSWIASVPVTGKKKSLLKIGEDCVLGNYNHIYASSSIIFEKEVLTADRVYISDCAHCYEDVSKSIIRQPIKQLNEIIIGEGAWLGENVCIIGASVGKHSIVGANSVVTKDIPDFSVAVGSPAKVVKRYDFILKEWVKC